MSAWLKIAKFFYKLNGWPKYIFTIASSNDKKSRIHVSRPARLPLFSIHSITIDRTCFYISRLPSQRINVDLKAFAIAALTRLFALLWFDVIAGNMWNVSPNCSVFSRLARTHDKPSWVRLMFDRNRSNKQTHSNCPRSWTEAQRSIEDLMG